MRILGLDVGQRRIGVALCDELGLTAQGLATIEGRNRQEMVERLALLVEEYNVERIVVGYPLRLDQTAGIQCGKVDGFIKRLAARVKVPIVRHDETLSTQEAHEIMRARGLSLRGGKKAVDRIAAAVILQGYLDAAARQRAQD